MQWLLDNWIWILLGGGFIAMHMFGHGGHGGRGKRSGHGGGGERCGGASKSNSESQPDTRSTTIPRSKSGDYANEVGSAEKRRAV